MGHVKRKGAFEESVDSEGPDQTARMHSLIRAFTVAKKIVGWVLQNVCMESKG